MKIGNKQLVPPKPVEVTIYRDGDNGPENIEFVCGAVLDYSEFERHCPQPKPPLVTKVKGGSYQDTNHRTYKLQVDAWSNRRVDWMIIQSLRATPGLEWELVRYETPDTWSKYEEELKSFCTEREFDRIINAVVEANSPNKNRRKEALENFTSSQEEEVDSTQESQVDEPTTTQSSEPAND